MKVKIIFTAAIVACVCMVARFGPGVLNARRASGSKMNRAASNGTNSAGSHNRQQEEWVSAARGFVAAMRYFFEPEPPAVDDRLMASNNPSTFVPGPGYTSPRTSSGWSNLDVSIEISRENGPLIL